MSDVLVHSQRNSCHSNPEAETLNRDHDDGEKVEKLEAKNKALQAHRQSVTVFRRIGSHFFNNVEYTSRLAQLLLAPECQATCNSM